VSRADGETGGYRPNPALSLGGFLSAMLFVAAYVVGVSLLGRAIGERTANIVVGLGGAPLVAWGGYRHFRHPLADDSYALDEERREARRAGAFAMAMAAAMAVLTLGRLYFDLRHGR